MHVVAGIALVDGTSTKCLTGIDDHSRFAVYARLMPAERTRFVCDALQEALVAHGAPEQILTDNGKVFIGRFNHPPVEVLLDAICRRNGIEHLLTQPRSPTTTGVASWTSPSHTRRVEEARGAPMERMSCVRPGW